MAHRGKIIDLVGLGLLDNPDQIGGVGQVAIMQRKMDVGFMRILVEMVDPVCIEKGGPSLDTVNDIS